MSRMNLVVSNRVEWLVKKLIGVLKTSSGDPFQTEMVVVQNMGMEHWLSQRIADTLGICSNIRFFHPNSFIDAAFQAIQGGHFKPQEFSQDVLVWKIIRHLPALLDESCFKDVKSYLCEKDLCTGEVKLYQLARKIAHLFDQYLTYRPDMMAEWTADRSIGLEHEEWQKCLWQKLIASGITEERKTLLNPTALLDRIHAHKGPVEGLPPRVSIFCASALPLHYLTIIKALSEKIDISVYLFNPCREYWFDIKSAGMTAKNYLGNSPGNCHFEEGNALLASLGRAGKEFFELIYDAVDHDDSNFEEPGTSTLLSAVQTSILNLSESPGSADSPLHPAQVDDSIQVHSCHSPLREIEVLLDYLLNLFDKSESFTPRDILVMAPSIDEYAPYIEAVFKDSGIPFSIAQSAVLSESPLTTTFMEILELYFYRFELSRVFTLLGKPLIQARFGIKDEQLEALEKWVSDTKIRWGFDSDCRKRLGLPEYAENTWKSGIDRMLLGYAIPNAAPEFVESFGMLPYNEIEGSNVVALGNFIDFVEKLAQFLEGLRAPRTLGEWASCLRKASGDFLTQSESQDYELKKLLSILDSLGPGEESIEGLSSCDQKISFEALYRFLKDLLSSESFPYGFFRGGVTFAEFQPLKSIPSSVICLAGMNFDVFPRRENELCYDLMALEHRAGDRNIRDNDKYLFLEALLSARKKLFISYIGQSIIDNALCPPSIVVSELLDFITRKAAPSDRQVTLDKMIFRHRLHGFSPDYFRKGAHLFSYSDENRQAAEKLAEYLNAAPGVSTKPSINTMKPLVEIDEPPNELKTVDLAELIRFFSNPARFFAQKRLGIHVDAGAELPLDNELFKLEGLDRYQVATDMIAHTLEKRPANEFYREMKARGALPPGNIGVCEFDMLTSLVQPFTGKVQSLLTKEDTSGGKSIPVNIDIQGTGFRVTGSLGKLYRNGIIEYSFSTRQAKYYLTAWIKHLVLNIIRPGDTETSSYCISRKSSSQNSREKKVLEVRHFKPIDIPGEAMRRLEKLIELYRAGLRKPMLFFPDTSLAFAGSSPEKDEESAVNKARYIWDNEFKPEFSEMRDPYFRLFFRDIDPFEGEERKAFTEVSLEIFKPLLTGSEEV
ncbi:MAG: exodeoxyribonuclease V subunit gamma [Candidatus Xenobiia bacterium LiM19]